MKVKKITVGFIQENCYIVFDEKTKDAVVIDPGADGEDIVEELEGLNLKAILATHGHIDHVGQVGYLKDLFNVPFYMNFKDRFLTNEELFPSFAKTLNAYRCPDPDFDLGSIDRLEIGDLKFDVIKTPGHTPGGVSFYSKENNFILVGDTLFAGSVGRIDLPGGDSKMLEKSLNRLMELPEETIVYSGHGVNTTIGKEKKTNPFITGRFKLKW
ncbi:MAG: MBL fold metallo-hydrolase [Hydrogenothermaceae bacterium]